MYGVQRKSIFICLCLLVSCGLVYAQELVAGRGDRWAETQETSAEFYVDATSVPANIFIQIADIYIHFAEQARGFFVYDGGLIHSDPAIYTIQNQQYHFKVESGKVYRDDTLIWETMPGPVRVGTYSCAARVEFVAPALADWDFTNGIWILPADQAPFDTLFADTVIVSWEHDKQDALGDSVSGFGGFDLKVYRDDVLTQQIQTDEFDLKVATPSGKYEFLVAAFDKAGNYSTYVDPAYIILPPKVTDALNFDCNNDGQVDLTDQVDCWFEFINHKLGFARGNVGYDERYDFDKSGIIDIDDFHEYTKRLRAATAGEQSF